MASRLRGAKQAWRNEKSYTDAPLCRNFSLVAQIPTSLRKRGELSATVDRLIDPAGAAAPGTIAATSPIGSRTRRKLGDEIDVLAIAPDAQWQPRSGRLPGDHFDQFVRLLDSEAGGPHDLIPHFQAGNFGYAVADHPVDTRGTIAFHQRNAEPWTLGVRRFFRVRQRKYGVRKGCANQHARLFARHW